MSEFKNVLKRLQDEEVKLSSEKVELASLSEVKSLSVIFKNNVENLEPIYEEYIKLRKQAKSGFSRSTGIGEELEKMLLDFEKKAKELGISADSVKEYKQAKIYLDKAYPKLKEMKKYIR